MEDPSEFPKLPEPGGRNHALEATGSMVWTLLFLAYSSQTFAAEFGQGWAAAWTIILVVIPATLAGIPAILDRRPRAIRVLLSYLVYAILPSLIQLSRDGNNKTIAAEFADLITVLLIWLPIELRLLSTDLSPTGKVKVWGLLTAALSIVNIFTVLRPFANVPDARELGFSFKLTPYDAFVSVSMGVLYFAVALPLATAMRFARFKKPSGIKLGHEGAALVGIYMSSLTEELLFRGLIQNMIEQRLGQTSFVALVLGAIAYGVAHLRKSKNGFDAPNYRYSTVAIVCGVFSGLVWRWTGKVTASAITHALGNFALWRVFLSEPNEQ